MTEELQFFEPLVRPWNGLGRYGDSTMDFAKFYKVLNIIWENAHPDIKMFHAGQEFLNPTFPCITVSVLSEIPTKGYPKPRIVEIIPGSTGSSGCNVSLIQSLMQTELIIRIDIFSTNDSGGPETAELICAEFKSFMQEYAPAFMAKGLGDIRFYKRFVDESTLKLGDIYAVKRSLAYQAQSQDVTYTTVEQLETIQVEIQLAIDFEGTESVEFTVPEP
jgi:hypothetical protein